MDETRLFLYEEAWNSHGHRSARQDWWCEVVIDETGTMRKVGEWAKHNVGYKSKPGQAWCYPYRKLAVAEIVELKRAAASLRQAPAEGGLRRSLNAFCS